MIVCPTDMACLRIFTIALLCATSSLRAQDAPESTPEEQPAQAPSRPQSLLPGQIDAPQSADIAPTEAASIPLTPVTDDTAVATGSSAAPTPASVLAPAASSLRNPAAALGVLDPTTGGYGETLWSGSAGSFVTQVLNRMQAPIGSRFGQIMLRRALASRAVAPRGGDAVGFDTARAQMLLRMGEADLASRLVAQVPQASYNRRLYTVAGQSHLAAFNVPATCPLAARAIVFSQDPLWPLLSAICAALQGDEGGAALGLELARDSAKVNRFDLAIADRMVTAVTGGGRGGVVDWPAKGKFTTYRVAAIYLGGQVLPPAAIQSSNAAVQGWLAQSGAVDSQTRWQASWTAASMGVLNTDAWIGLWSSRGAEMTPAALAYAPEGYLMRANSGKLDNRLKAMQHLWSLGKSDRGRLAMYLLTSDAAARLPVMRPFDSAAPDLVRAMLMGGKFEAAQKWYQALSAHSSGSAQAAALEIWAALEILDDRKAIAGSEDKLKAWINAQSADNRERRGRLALGALRGLGAPYAQDASVGVSVDETPGGKIFELLDAAAKRKARGEVIVLSALLLGDQPASVNGESLEQIVRALRSVGLEKEARLIAMEAVLMATP
jgi:hypothetical protein